MHKDVPGTSVLWNDLDNDPHFGVAASLPACTVKSFYRIARVSMSRAATCKRGFKTHKYSFVYQMTDVSELHPF